MVTRKIYFAGAIAGGRAYLQTYKAIVAEIKSSGCQVLTEHVAQENVLDNELKLTPNQIYNRDISWLAGCDALIAEVSNPSLGVGYEIRYAMQLGKPILCLYQWGIFLSCMISGNPYEKLHLRFYKSHDEMISHIDDFLNGVA